MSTVFYTCRILFGWKGHILAGMSCEECPGTGDCLGGGDRGGTTVVTLIFTELAGTAFQSLRQL